jgi:hypothetical protein
MESPEFLPFSDALMAAFASRPHEWSDWEIRETHEHLHETSRAPQQAILHSPPRTRLRVSASVLIAEGERCSFRRLVCDPEVASPSQTASELLRPSTPAPLIEGLRFRAWNDGPDHRWDHPFETELLRDPGAWLLRIENRLAEVPATLGWLARGSVREQRIRNSRGLRAQFTDTEVLARVGARTVYAAAALDDKLFEKKLRSFNF